MLSITILFTLPSLSPTHSKVPRVLAICKALDRQRFRPIVSVDHTGRLNPDGVRLFEEAGVPAYLIRMSPHRQTLARSLVEMLATPRTLRKLGVVIQHSEDYGRGVTEPLLARLGGVRRWIATKTNADFSSPLWRIRFAFADAIIAQSPTMARIITAQIPGASSKVVIIPNGVDSQLFRPKNAIPGLRSQLGLLPDSLVLGCVAHLTAVKDHPSLIRALSLAVHRDIELLLVGRPVDRLYEQRLRNLVHELGVEERVYFLGHRKDVSDLHSIMDGIVLTSRGESLPNAILEGMASSLPVISSDCGGMRDVVQNGVNGWLVPRDEDFVARLAEVIDEWAADPIRRKEYGATSRRIVEERFSLTQMVQGHIKLYESLLQEDA